MFELIILALLNLGPLIILRSIVDFNVCNIYFVFFTNKENYAFDTIPFVKLIRNKYTAQNI